MLIGTTAIQLEDIEEILIVEVQKRESGIIYYLSTDLGR